MESVVNMGQIPAGCDAQCGPTNASCCSFSEQEIVDCTLGGADTCKKGGEPHDGIIEVVNRNGTISTESSTEVATGIIGYFNGTHGDETALATEVGSRGVISIGIDASGIGFQMYAGGVYSDKQCKNSIDKLDHGVAIVGYGVGSPLAPGPTPPKPGPADCKNNHYKFSCTREKGCYWCKDASGLEYCFNQQCPMGSAGAAARNSSAAASAPAVAAAAAAAVRNTNVDTSYWMLRNSWGWRWGLGGYVTMAHDDNNMCGVATDAVFAVTSSS